MERDNFETRNTSTSQPADATIGGRSFAEHNAIGGQSSPQASGEPRLTQAPRRPATDSAAAVHAQHAQLLKDIANRFTYHAPQPDQLPRYAALRDRARELAVMIADLTPTSREQALALTHLETSIFFANAAIARNE